MGVWKNKSLCSMKGEVWVSACGYFGHYEVSNFGRVKSLMRKVNHGGCGTITMKERIISQKLKKNGYLEVNLSLDGCHRMHFVHRLVAECFLDNPMSLPEVNHKTGDPTDNRSSELEWVTSSQNHRHAYEVLKRSGVNCGRVGVNNKLSKPVYCPTLGVSFPSIKDASVSLGVRFGEIINVCKGRISHIGGITFRYSK